MAMPKRTDVVRIAEKDEEYGRCGTCTHYQHLMICGNCHSGNRYAFNWKSYYEENKGKFEKKEDVR